MTLSFPTKEHHKAALYDACLLIVNTYNETTMFEDLGPGHSNVNLPQFSEFAKHVLNQIAEGN